MKIIRKETNLVRVSTIKVGQTFIEEDEIFMMCQYVGNVIECPRCEEEISISEEVRYLAVMLSNGELFDFEPFAEVELVECEVIEI